jgi:hypothetical protein
MLLFKMNENLEAIVQSNKAKATPAKSAAKPVRKKASKKVTKKAGSL